ncbi:MAG: hypothetical protein AB8B85_04785, partial [Paracoccaceae bacterium]
LRMAVSIAGTPLQATQEDHYAGEGSASRVRERHGHVAIRRSWLKAPRPPCAGFNASLAARCTEGVLCTL